MKKKKKRAKRAREWWIEAAEMRQRTLCR